METDPYHAAQIRDFLDGWDALQCTAAFIPNVNGA